MRSCPAPPAVVVLGKTRLAWGLSLRSCLMSVLKRLARASGAALVLAAATISTSANAGWNSPFWGVGPENNGFGFGPAGSWGVNNPRWFGINPEYAFGFGPSVNLGMAPQQNIGFGPAGAWG